MSRAHWPATLDELLAEPVVPHCPETCAFRELCPTIRQVGIADLFRKQRYTDPQQCLWWEKLAALTRQELGIEPPASAAALTEAMGERRAIREAS
jgi:hypothetical protein